MVDGRPMARNSTGDTPPASPVTATVLLGLLLAVCSSATRSEPGGWDEFTPDLYLVGRGSSAHPDATARRALARDDALAMLSRSVKARVVSRSETVRTERPDGYQESAQIHNMSTSSIEVRGTRFLEQAAPERLDVLAYISHEEARRVHYGLADDVLRDLAERVGRARSLAEGGDRAEALNVYARAFPLLPRLDDVRAVLIAAGGQSPDLPFTRASIAREMTALEGGRVSSMKDAVGLLVLRLEKSGTLGDRLYVKPFTHEDTGFASPFSKRVHRLMEMELGSRIGVANGPFAPKSADYAREEAFHTNADTVLSGTYEETGDGVSVFVRAVGSDNQLLASAEVIVPKTLVVEERLALQPDNYAQARQDAALIAAGEALSGPLRIEMWTDLGRDALLFTAGQRYRLFVRANAACTVRLLYHLSDGTRVVMYEDYAIPAGRANQAVEIPEPFVVTAPYGAEIIQAFAYAGPPPSMKVRERTIAGMPYTVVDEPLDAVMKAFMKGFARGGGDGAAPPSATVQLPVTTVPLP
jgi:hypothetical protein